ncbi:MAG: hypothetical protein KC589_00185 [Nanoarchaeota archaeon]|nr:hypothetical protein [Nanoarchaeota archaeon]
MVKVHITELITSVQDSNFLWLIIPIFFIGIITDKYQEEFGTSIGNAISNGALIIFTGFSWLQLISSRTNFENSFILSQIILSVFIIIYGFMIIASGFKTGEFGKTYGRIRVVTFMLIFFTIIIYVPLLYNFISIILYVLIFPFYYITITKLIKIMPSAGGGSKKFTVDSLSLNNKSIGKIKKDKIKEYLE